VTTLTRGPMVLRAANRRPAEDGAVNSALKFRFGGLFSGAWQTNALEKNPSTDQVISCVGSPCNTS
jgi:hypothetical protein